MNMVIRSCVCLAAMLLTIPCLAADSESAAAQAEKQLAALRRNTLRDMRAVRVWVVFSGERRIAGMDSDDVRKLVSLELRKHKIPILNRDSTSVEELNQTVMLYVNVDILDVTPALGRNSKAWTASAQVMSGVGLLRDPNIKSYGATWQARRHIGIGVEGASESIQVLRNAIMELSEEFASDFLEANGK